MFDIKSAVIAGLVGTIIGGVACAALHIIWLDPALVESTTTSVTKQVRATVTAERDLACVDATSEAERQARLAAQARQIAAVDTALEAYRKSAAESARVSAAEIANLESEIRSYDEKLKTLGRFCAFGPDDYSFIYGDGVPVDSADGQ